MLSDSNKSSSIYHKNKKDKKKAASGKSGRFLQNSWDSGPRARAQHREGCIGCDISGTHSCLRAARRTTTDEYCVLVLVPAVLLVVALLSLFQLFRFGWGFKKHRATGLRLLSACQ